VVRERGRLATEAQRTQRGKDGIRKTKFEERNAEIGEKRMFSARIIRGLRNDGPCAVEKLGEPGKR
jgi:hypothetical protein